MRTLHALGLALAAIVPLVVPPDDTPPPTPRVDARVSATIRSGVRSGEVSTKDQNDGAIAGTTRERACDGPVKHCRVIVRDMP